MNTKKSVILIFFIVLFLTACTGFEPKTGDLNDDPCASQNVIGEVKKIKELVDEFDDISFIANLTPQTQLAEPIMKLQTVRRKLANSEYPVCLKNLQNLALDFMNSEINYLAHFMGGAPREIINKEMTYSHQLRDSYEKELAALLETEYQPFKTSTPFYVLPTPNFTSIASTATSAKSRIQPLASNTSNQSINIRIQPDLESPIAGYLLPGDSIGILGKSNDSIWLSVNLGKENKIAVGWLYLELVSLNVSLESLPVIESEITD